MLVNGSPHHHGCTYTALEEVAKVLNSQGIETEHFWVGTKPIMGCIGCGKCSVGKRCWYTDDTVNAFMDRAFCSKLGLYADKPAAAIVSCRRGGAQGGFEDLNRYFTIANMPVVSSEYWNEVHGNTPEEVVQDQEGMQVIRQLGRNMAGLLQCIEAGRKAGVAEPEHEPKVKTNFIR